ncbi:MAG: bifunctional 23S rRNA (guanine(2069)-N(7))-methyltransferase RlmK/23S rRNA (guanine(2445)-N(2))-methyltransferase RlmL [Planctomycetaceae bacterium]|nr:bifunctional 23S rRNA (guanine(2069)-N(7))-methyltransferase RlmK/23S rRNA (guanine(2445)-N(2))-methyltransferase RlmL [Planctomycetaceae bacterium]
MSNLQLIATCAFGLEAIVKRELQELGYQAQTIQPGRIMFSGETAAICRGNLFLRCAERILICVGRFEATDFGQLYDQTHALPWHEFIPPDGSFVVKGKSIKSQLSSVPACQRMVKKAVADKLLAGHSVVELPETGANFPVEVALLDNVVTLSIDTSGQGLHKRGYRPMTGPAPLRETLAAALIQLSFWKNGRPLIDPFCGTGTIPIEAAMLGRRIAPGLKRSFEAETWDWIPKTDWALAREEARDLILPGLEERILGTDASWKDLKLARQHATSAGVADDIHFQQIEFRDLTSKRKYGCLICNPPYGRRLGERHEVLPLYQSFPLVLRRLPTWSHFVLTALPDFERVIGQSADRRRKLYNGRIECQYFQFHGPRPPEVKSEVKSEVKWEVKSDSERSSATADDATNVGDTVSAETVQAADDPETQQIKPPSLKRRSTIQPVFGGIDQTARRQADEFRNRLTKRARHLRRWPGRGITCYRLYERDIPEVPLVVDRYEDHLHLAEFNRPHERTIAEHADWLDLMAKTAAEVMEIRQENVFVKHRNRQRGSTQYEKVSREGRRAVVGEAGLKFRVNLSDYLDTGLFLDHRQTRQMVREEAAGKRFLNLFGYTGSFTVYAAAGGATSSVTIDSSQTYLSWAEDNLSLNQLKGRQHRMIRGDVTTYLRDLHRDVQFDLVVIDPPTFSNSKEFSHDWDIQRDHVSVLQDLRKHMPRGGVVFFSTNFRRFKLAESELEGFQIREISKQTVPPDFRNRRIHRCWRFDVQ